MARIEDDLPRCLAPAAEALRAGEFVAVPTETVYGLACDAFNPEAVARLRAVKGRGDDHPLPVQVAHLSDLRTVARDLPPVVHKLASRYWPGPLTIVCPRAAALPGLVTSDRDTVGVRLPDHPVARALLRLAGKPLAVPSANRTGHAPLTTAEALVEEFGGQVAIVIDTDRPPPPDACPSTVVDATIWPPKVLREGALSTQEILTACTAT